MKRRAWLKWGCAHCMLLSGAAQAADWVLPTRLGRPDPASDEGGLWALLDREETRVRRSPLRLRDAGLQSYLEGVVGRLAGEHAADMRVYALRVPMFNASMAPNGMMQIWSGLLLRVDNEAQLAAVLGHEIGHYLERHSVARLRDAKSRSALGTFLAVFGLVGAVGALATVGGAYAFSREHEREADRIGVELMRRAGYETGEASKIWGNLLAELKAAGVDDPAQNALFATHPANDERRADLQALTLQDARGETREAEFRALIAPWRFSLLEDELRRRRFEESIVLLDRRLASEPGDPELLYFRGEARRLRNRDGDLDLALADLEQSVRSGREPAVAHRSLGTLHRAQDRHDAARQALQRYLERAPEAPDAAFIRQTLEELPS